MTTLTYDPGAGWNNTFRQASFAGGSGDSGATVVWPTIFGYGAVGIVKSGTGSLTTYASRASSPV